MTETVCDIFFKVTIHNFVKEVAQSLALVIPRQQSDQSDQLK